MPAVTTTAPIAAGKAEARNPSRSSMLSTPGCTRKIPKLHLERERTTALPRFPEQAADSLHFANVKIAARFGRT